MPHVTPKQAAPTSGAQPQANREERAAAFGEKLRTLEEKEGLTARRAVEERPRPNSQKRMFEDDRQSSVHEGEVLAQTLVGTVNPQRPGMMAAADVAPQSALSDTAQAHLDRVAAAIAEAVGNGGDQVATVDFGADDALIKSAVIARDATGMISIKMVTPNAALQPLAWTVLRNQLSDRLEKRKIGVKSIDLQAEEAHNRVARKT